MDAYGVHIEPEVVQGWIAASNERSSRDLKRTFSMHEDDFVCGHQMRQVYRMIHAAVQMGAIRAHLEMCLPTWPEDIVNCIAWQFYKSGGTIEELERGYRSRYVSWSHPLLDEHKRDGDYQIIGYE